MKLNLKRSVQIQASSSHVYGIISDIRQWNTWSPWMQCEPTAKTHAEGQVHTEGQSQTWDGEVVGSGKMTFVKLEKNRLVRMKLEFFKPWKSLAQAEFHIEENSAQGCTVTWKLESSLPIFMFFFKKMMIAYMENDFNRGLQMLKELAETGDVVSKSIYQGEKTFPGFQILGKTTACKISEMPSLMKQDFEHMTSLLKKGELPPPDQAMALYQKFDIPKGVCEYTAAFSYKPETKLKTPPPGMSISQFPEHKALAVDFYGPYRNLGNPWSMAISYQRGKKKKVLKSIPMHEIYKTMPDGRPEKDIHTQIILPIKS